MIPCYIETMSRPRLAVTTLFFMYTIDNVELHIRVITSHYRVITKISPGDNFYTVQLFPLIRPHSGIEVRIITAECVHFDVGVCTLCVCVIECIYAMCVCVHDIIHHRVHNMQCVHACVCVCVHVDVIHQNSCLLLQVVRSIS